MVQLSIQAVNNQNLFSNHYLKNLIRNNDEWRSNDHETVFDEIKKIYNAEKPFLENLNESQLEERFFRRIFKIMLPDFEVQAGTESQDFPDYAFFEDTNALNVAHLNKGSRSFYQNAFAVGEVKRWDTNLDRFGKGKHDKNTNPSFQIWLYLHETEPEWGILPNGRLWRRYHQDKLMDSYYEVDLVTILEKGGIDAFKYFYYFFRRGAFFPSQKGAIFLENVLKGSEDYTTEIGEDLKENVYRAMKIETLTNRTKLKQYYDLDFDELLDILKKNKKKLPVNPSNRELQKNLKEEFEGSLRKLRPLIERIENADELIDQVVYRLYGLSEGDVKIIEEGGDL